MRCALPAVPAVLLLALAMTPDAARADVKDISITVKGVTCPVCTHSINIAVRRLAGVKSTKIALATRVVLDVTPHSGAWVEPSQIIRQISLTGFQAKPDEVKLRLQGDIAVSGERMMLTLSDIASPLAVRLLIALPETRDAHSGSIGQELADLKASLTAGASSTRHVEIEGWWRSAKDSNQLAALVPTKLTVLP